MSEFRFIHTGDLHIDSPLKGLEAYEGAPVQQIRQATRDAFENVVELALAEQVDFVLIAGDLFDGKWPDISTGMWTHTQLLRMTRTGIRVFVIRGNHDAASKVPQRLPWPEGVHELSCERPESVTLDELQVAIHGQGFAQQEVTQDLAAEYPDATPGHFNIGMLHTSLTGDPAHDPYAPTSEQTLKLRGYDYWALGHIHLRHVIHEDPFIGYCGNTQGRHINEQGEKGCLLVTVRDHQVEDIAFRATDVLEWFTIDLTLQPADGLPETFDRVQDDLRRLRESVSADKLIAVRIRISGSSKAHRSLCSGSEVEAAVSHIRLLASELDSVWVEKVQIATSPQLDLEQLRNGGDLMGDLLRGIDALSTGPADDLADLTSALEPLRRKGGADVDNDQLAMTAPDQLREWLRRAESILVSRLAESEHAVAAVEQGGDEQ